MSTPDLSVFSRFKTVQDFDREREAYEARKREQALNEQMQRKKIEDLNMGRNLPSSIQLANEIEKALNSGDVQRANLLTQSAKMYDKGINPFSQDGGYGAQQMEQYAEAIGGIEATKKGMSEQAKKNVELSMNPKIEYETKKSAELGKVSGERANAFQEAKARMPQMEKLVNELHQLGNAATYTLAGRAKDAFYREMGYEVPDSAVARAEYISKVDNEILPLLRQTFGAQFTQKEGESLKATLGDPNRSPREKDAVLRSFIKTKMGEINTMSRMNDGYNVYSDEEIKEAPRFENVKPQAPKKGEKVDGFIFMGGNPADKANWKRVK